jgi:hypothetical protein
MTDIVDMFTPKVIEYKEVNSYVDEEPKDDRYYTPTIEEWHVGFEYEQRREEWDPYYPGIKILKYIWEPVVGNLGSEKGSLYQFKEGIDPDRKGKHYRFTDGILEPGAYSNMIRVKYLDKEDVESVLKGLGCEIINDGGGWKKSYLDELEWWVEGMISEKSGSDFFISKDKNGKISIEEDETFRFEGNIKNKSGLIKILDQLGYGTYK